MPEAVVASGALTAPEVERFHADGWIGPFTCCAPEEMAAIRRDLEATLLGTPTVYGRGPYQTRHLDHPTVFDLCRRAPILDRLERLLGPDLVLWQSNHFIKVPPGDRSLVPWHQDRDYWPIEPPLTISAWLAIDDADVGNSCVHVIPGSHRTTVPHVPMEDPESGWGKRADPACVDASRAVPVEVRAGEFFLFTERLLHHSPRLRSERRRWGMAIRYTVPFVRVLEEHPVVLVRGQDRFGFNRLSDGPVSRPSALTPA